MANKRIVISVISDLATDQRVKKVAETLHLNGYDVFVIGAKRRNSKSLDETIYPRKRIALFFQKGFLMYAEWNTRLFFKLFFQKTDVLLANDLDTLLPNFIHSKLRQKKLVYDSHEYFTEQFEIQGRPFVKNVWLTIEKFLFPKLKNVYTVNKSIAAIYKEKYNIELAVVRNVPKLNDNWNEIKKDWTQFEGKKILLSQGSGMNSGRGYEELVQSINLLSKDHVLVLVGTGLVLDDLKTITKNQHLGDRVFFLGLMSPNELKEFTKLAYVGFSLDKATCLNHHYSLPNKLFDYIAAGVPVIASNMPEVTNIVHTYDIGIVIDQVLPHKIAEAVKLLENNSNQYQKFQKNTTTAIHDLNWANEEKVLLSVFENLQ